MHREAWQATVHWVAQSWMEQPSNFRFHFSGACSSGERLIMRNPWTEEKRVAFAAHCCWS